MNSIFHKLVTKEDDLTQLLFNFIERVSDFRGSVLAWLLPGTSISGVRTEQIHTQASLGDCGRVDIEIASGEVYALIEVKLDLGCGLTQNQEMEPAEELTGYLAAISKRKEREKRFVFLAPRHWNAKWQQSVLDRKSAYCQRGIEVDVKHWEGILELINREFPSGHNSLVDEFRSLLLERFGPIVFSAEEANMLFSKNFVDGWETIRKLQTLIDQIATKGKGAGYGISTSKTKDEYGLSFNDKFWFGMWLPFSQQQALPLCFGIQNNKAKSLPNLRTAFESAFTGTPKQCNGWTMGWITQEALEMTDPVETVWAQLQPILASILDDHQA